jgi:hypothetical protein
MIAIDPLVRFLTFSLASKGPSTHALGVDANQSSHFGKKRERDRGGPNRGCLAGVWAWTRLKYITAD